MAETVGRNDPCPCGSVKKYKHCCLGRNEEVKGPFPGGGDPFADLRRELGAQCFANKDEVKAFMESYMERQGQIPIEDFQGLTSEQMHCLLNAPFDSPDLVTFPETAEAEVEEVPLLVLLRHLTEGIGEKGMKTTATGNLRRNFCREVAREVMGEKAYAWRTEIGNINREDEYIEFHVARVVAELAKIIRKDGRKFVLMRNAKKVLTESGVAGFYPKLFRVYSREFNWSYWDERDELAIIQRSFLFTLYLLFLFGDEWRSRSFYEDCFLRAFPVVLGEVEDQIWAPAEQQVRDLYTERTFVNYAENLGLAILERELDQRGLERIRRVKKGPMFDRAVQFHIRRG